MKIIKSNIDSSENVLPFIPLRDMVIFPTMIKSFFVGRKESIIAIEKSKELYNNNLILITQKNSKVEKPDITDLYEVGVVGKILEVHPTPDKNVIKVTVQGLTSCEIININKADDFYDAQYIPKEPIYIEDLKKVETLFSIIIKEFKNYLELTKSPLDVLKNLERLSNHLEFFNTIISNLSASTENLITILEDNRIDFYFSKLAEIIYANIENIYLERKISLEVRKKMEKNQKDYYLHEQMKEIQKELGNFNDDLDLFSIQDFENKLLELKIPEEISEKIIKEQKRMIKMPPVSQEIGLINNYIDTIIELPWHQTTEDNKDLHEAKKILDSKHYSLKKVKNRILEFLAVRQLNPNTKGPILCFIGPPGTGKTSLATSVAKAINRDFVRISLGGVRDEAEIRGHRRTYLGALPGKIINAMRKVKKINPVILLDEIDKMSSDFRGDPASALLEVLDPEQNFQFTDHFLELPYDLSKVMFICTANSMQGIPYPLLDRMELIYINSYSDYEKKKIAKEFLFPKEKIENGINEIPFFISNKALQEIIQYYTRESGVRSLQRQIATICRKIARKIVMEELSKDKKITISTRNLPLYLGKKKYLEPDSSDFLDAGVAHGLAWSELGGALLPIEIVLYPGKGDITLTGKLGEVMQESVHTAFSYIKSRSNDFNIAYNNFSKDYNLHIHFPEGATPKDGPSAGIAITTGIISALTQIPIKSSIAMTGEVTLTGKILPIGGLREKSLAALRHGKKTVIIPETNLKDINEISKQVRNRIDFITVKRVDDLLKIVFEDNIYKKSTD